MTPGRGVGANTALRDAVNLCRQLIDVRDGRQELIAAVHEYEAKMIEYGFDAVIKSRAQMTATTRSTSRWSGGWRWPGCVRRCARSTTCRRSSAGCATRCWPTAAPTATELTLEITPPAPAR